MGAGASQFSVHCGAGLAWVSGGHGASPDAHFACHVSVLGPSRDMCGVAWDSGPRCGAGKGKDIVLSD